MCVCVCVRFSGCFYKCLCVFASVLCAFMSVFAAGPASVCVSVIKLSCGACCRAPISSSLYVSVINLVCPMAAPQSTQHFNMTLCCQGTLLWGRRRGATETEDRGGRRIIIRVKITLFLWHLSTTKKKKVTKCFTANKKR